MAHTKKNNSPGCTGPSSPSGKERSSRNALKHGLCSEKLILPNENPSELEEIKNKWLNDPNYDEPLLLTLAEQVAVAEWFYRRALNQYNQTEQHLYELQPDLFSRTPDQIKLLERFQRYLTTRERAFNRAVSAYQRLHNDCQRIYEKGNQLLENVYQLVKSDPDLNSQLVTNYQDVVRWPRRYLSTVNLTHPLRPELPQRNE